LASGHTKSSCSLRDSAPEASRARAQPRCTCASRAEPETVAMFSRVSRSSGELTVTSRGQSQTRMSAHRWGQDQAWGGKPTSDTAPTRPGGAHGVGVGTGQATMSARRSGPSLQGPRLGWAGLWWGWGCSLLRYHWGRDWWSWAELKWDSPSQGQGLGEAPGEAGLVRCGLLLPSTPWR